MEKYKKMFFSIDTKITAWMAGYGLVLLRCSMGIVFLWFGALKFIPGLSPAQDLAIKTIDAITFGLIPGSVSLAILAAWECLIGLGLITGVYMRATLLLLWLQMLGAAMPLFLFPHEAFTRVPYAPTLEGQYIIKNLVIIKRSIAMNNIFAINVFSLSLIFLSHPNYLFCIYL